jgi:lipoprotein-anchoring transpeptidase ErfK/SrfK
VKVYFTAGEQFMPVAQVPKPAGSIVEAAAHELFQGPPPGREAETQIPADAELEHVSVSDDGTAVVEVSREFLEGVPSKAAARNDEEDAELSARLGQVTYTLTQFDRVKATKVVAGGVAVKPPLERADYRQPKQGPQREPHPAAAAKSLATRQVQERLAKLGYLPPGAVDGVPGYRTEQAVVAFQAWEGLDRDGVVGPMTTAALADAKRPRPRPDGPARRIEVYRDKGVVLLVAHGKTRRAIHVSSGGPGNETPAGTFTVFRKELRSWSVPFSVWLPYASYFNQGIAFHEYPDVPPYPASHGCVRVPAPEAEGVYRFAKFDTIVVVI